MLGNLKVLIISALVVLGLFEGLLRIGHSLYFREESSELTGLDVSGGRRSFRIVTLGESTTAVHRDETGVDISWPALLESPLESEFKQLGFNIDVQIFNRGRSASSSGFLVDGFQREVDALQPDLVISMMGINDSQLFAVDRGLLFQNSYLYRFVFWSWHFSDCPECFGNSSKKVDASSYGNAPALSAQESASLEKLKSYYLEYLKSRDLKKAFLDFIKKLEAEKTGAALSPAAQLGFVVYLYEQVGAEGQADQGKVKGSNVEKLFQFAAKWSEESLPRTAKIYRYGIEYYCHIQKALGESCMKLALQLFREGLEPNSASLSVLVNDRQSDNPEFNSILQSYGWELNRNRKSLELTRDSYKKLESVIRSKEIAWIAMQYPTGRPDGIPVLLAHGWENAFSIHSRFSDIMNYRAAAPDVAGQLNRFYLVSNENFAVKVAEHRDRFHYFRDYFGRESGLNFGHTNRNGSQLIVENIIEQMRPHWREILSAAD